MADNQRKYSNAIGPLQALKKDGNTFLYFGCEGYMTRIKMHSGTGQDGQPFQFVTASMAVDGHSRQFNAALPDLKIADENATVWLSLRFGGNAAERIIKIFNLSTQEAPKSVRIAVFGSLGINAYTGRDGAEHKTPQLGVGNFWLLERRNNAQNAGAPGQQQYAPPAAAPQPVQQQYAPPAAAPQPVQQQYAAPVQQQYAPPAAQPAQNQYQAPGYDELNDSDFMEIPDVDGATPF